jgi:hypothetical protein
MHSLLVLLSQFKGIEQLVRNNKAASENKKAPLPKRCCAETKFYIPSFPSMGGTNISVCAFEAFQPTVCLPWILFRQDSSERANK